MPHKTRWWHPTIGPARCEACNKIKQCLHYQGSGTAKCGYNCLCEDCYKEKVKHVYKVIIKKKDLWPRLFIVICCLFISSGILYLTHTLLYKQTIKNLRERVTAHEEEIARIHMTTEQEKQIYIDWAMSKSKNTSEQIIRQMVDAACESEFPALILAIIGAETYPKFDPGSISKKNCWGPMQVNPKVWIDTLIKEGIIKTDKDLFDPVLGVRSGIYVFCKYLEKDRGNLRKATQRYVGGIHNKKEAEKYFNLIQQYLGEIYLALYKGKQKYIEKGEDNDQEEETNN